ncbi:MAG: alcohol dehydrogenase catalytic domain-containing protein [Acidobacteria bacterium]|nr:alcohol dehydrogenase catalytic domain-containing protein [Acidobacteriota bacterium]
MKAKAAVSDGKGTFVVEEITLGEPQANEVCVQIKASGVCHTDFDHMNCMGRTFMMGHEGAGIVLQVGPNVTHVKEGDSVLLNWAIPCEDCFQCRRGAENICENRPQVPDERFDFRGEKIIADFNLGTMSTHTVVPRQAVIKMEVDIPFEAACILGCGVMTGFGSVVNAAKVQKESAVVVLGTGGVGLSVIQGAVYARARQIVAVDVNPNRLELALKFGATHTILADRDDHGLLDAARKVKELTEGRGADYAFECTAVPELGPAPLMMLRNGGTAVGVSGIEQVVKFDMELFEWDKLYINPLYGQCRPSIDFPMLLDLYRQKRLKLDEMVTRTYPLEDLAQAFKDMRAGRNAKGVLLMDEP